MSSPLGHYLWPLRSEEYYFSASYSVPSIMFITYCQLIKHITQNSITAAPTLWFSCTEWSYRKSCSSWGVIVQRRKLCSASSRRLSPLNAKTQEFHKAPWMPLLGKILYLKLTIANAQRDIIFTNIPVPEYTTSSISQHKSTYDY